MVADEKAALAAFAAVSVNTDAMLYVHAPVPPNQEEYLRSCSPRHVPPAEGGIRKILLVQTQTRTNRGVFPELSSIIWKRKVMSML